MVEDDIDVDQIHIDRCLFSSIVNKVSNNPHHRRAASTRQAKGHEVSTLFFSIQ